MNRNCLLFAMLLLLTALAAASCASSKSQPESTPTQSAASATATEEDIDGAITHVVSDYFRIEQVTIGGKTEYVDSSGTAWMRFDAYTTGVIRSGRPAGGTNRAFCWNHEEATGRKLGTI